MIALLISAVTDLRSRLIYNWVTGPAFLLEVALIGSAAGLPSLEAAGVGILVCAGPFALGTLFGAIGGGDLKLMAVVGTYAGAIGGWPFALDVLLAVSIAGGAQAALQWLWAALRRRERAKYVPYGVAIAAGSLWVLGGAFF